MATPPRSVFDTLTRLFLRRLLENDVIAPGADRHDSFAVALGAVITIPVFLAFLLSTKYLVQYIQLPGLTAHAALSDRFYLIAFSMAITALATLLMWDALGLEPRDGAILGPLPLETRLIARAKLTALLVFAAGFSCVFNAATSILYPLLMTDHIHLSATTLLRVVGAHAVSVMLASTCAFLTVLAIRHLLQAVVSARWFERVSSVVQAALIVLVTSTLLLLPAATADVSRDWLRPGVSPRVAWMPPLWFVGVYATLEGHALADARILVPHRLRLPARMAPQNEAAAAAYRLYDPLFRKLATSALEALSIAAAVALLGYAWNSRRLPLPTMWPLRRSRLRRVLSRNAARAIAPSAAVRAGFSFTLQTLTRSAPHRVAMSAALAFGGSAALVLAQAFRAVLHGGVAGTLPPPGVFAAQLAVLAALVAGFRHAVRMPAALAANWAVQMAWQGDQRQFLTGCRRAAIVLLVLAPLVAPLPLYAALAGWRVAIAHAVVCGLAAAALLDGLLLRFAKVPFASPYMPLVSPKVLWPVSVVALFVGPWLCGVAERAAFASIWSTILLIAAVGSIGAVLNQVRGQQDTGPESLVFDDLPVLTTQRLGLHDRVVG